VGFVKARERRIYQRRAKSKERREKGKIKSKEHRAKRRE